MNERIIKEAKEAYYGYIHKQDGIEYELMNYIKERLKNNKETISKLMELTKEKIDTQRMQEILNKKSKYKNNKKLNIDENYFIEGNLITPKGVILREESEIEKIIETYIDAILSRNAMVISDIGYSENSVKNLVLVIVKEALKKFEVDENLIQLLPYEEVNEEEFDLYKETEKIYIYLEDEDFKDEVSKNQGELIKGEIDEVIEDINKGDICKCAVIYTKDKDKAYEFINRVNGKNVFVNSTTDNIQDVEIDDLYIYKHVIYPIK